MTLKTESEGDGGIIVIDFELLRTIYIICTCFDAICGLLLAIITYKIIKIIKTKNKMILALVLFMNLTIIASAVSNIANA